MRTMLKSAFPLLAVVIGLVALPIAREAGAETLEVYGFGQFDYIQDFNRVHPNWVATLRPSRIPTTPGIYGADGQAITSARQSRLGAQGTFPTANGDVFARFEFDMYGTGVDEGQTTIRLRHAYGQYKNWLAGQTHTLFMDIDLFPNVVDYWGPCGMVFIRTPQFRYTKTMDKSSFAVAIEHVAGDIDLGQIRDLDPNLGANLVAVSRIPDLTAQFRSNQSWGHFQLAGIGRKFGYETRGAVDNEPKDSKWGGGVDASAVITVKEKTTLRLGGAFGTGIANYMNDGGMDLAPDGTIAAPEAKAVPLQGYTAYVDHKWTDKVSTALGYSRTQVDNTTLQTADAFHIGEYASVNVLYAPADKVFFAAEGLWGQRTDNGGAIGVDRRIQVSAHYGFSSKSQ